MTRIAQREQFQIDNVNHASLGTSLIMDLRLIYIIILNAIGNALILFENIDEIFNNYFEMISNGTVLFANCFVYNTNTWYR